MPSFSRRDLLRTGGAALAAAWIVAVAGYGYAAISVTPSVGGVIAAASAFVIAGTGILYAWRDSGR